MLRRYYLFQCLRFAKESIVILFAALFLSACSFPEYLKQTDELANQLHVEGVVQSHYLHGDKLRLHYVSRGVEDDNQIVVLFIHGTPGDWRTFAHQLVDDKLANKALLLAVDRPGWADSALAEYKVYTRFEEQAALLAPLLEKYGKEKHLVIVGHSYGASLVAYLALRYPQWVNSAVAIAGDLTSEYRKPRVYNRIGAVPFVYANLPDIWKGANDEVLSIARELDLFKDDWSSMAIPFLVIQGEDDGLVDPRNAEFAKQLKTKSTVTVVEGKDYGHILHITHKEHVNNLLLDVIENMNKTPVSLGQN